MRIFLIGYMGAGKSTVGKIVARKLKMNFIDFDNYIETKEQKTISDIFSTEGEEKFRILEKKYLQDMITKDNVVISLGGGTPCFNNNMATIKQNGISIYIEMTSDALVKRLIGSPKKRPLIRKMNETELKSFIEENMKKRSIFYRQSNHIIKYKMQTPEELATEIICLVKTN